MHHYPLTSYTLPCYPLRVFGGKPFYFSCHATSIKEEKCDVTLPWLQNFWITSVGSLSNENDKKAIGMISETTINTCITLLGTFLFARLLSFFLSACLHGGGGPQIGEVTCGGSPHLSCKRHQIKMRDYMDRRVTSPERATSPTSGPPPPCKQALKPT